MGLIILSDCFFYANNFLNFFGGREREAT